MKFISNLLDIIFPRHCIVCGEILSGEEKDICLNCLVRMPLIETRTLAEIEKIFWGIVPIERVASYIYYRKGSPYNRLLHHIKYKERPDVGVRLATNAATELKSRGFFEGVDAIVPLPLSKKKLKKRGYNQCDYIAQGIAKVTGIEIIDDCVVRNKANETQTHKSRDERWKNVEGIFSIINNEKIKNKHILLIDDVFTTGSTINACAKVLKKNGALAVYAATLSTVTGE